MTDIAPPAPPSRLLSLLRQIGTTVFTLLVTFIGLLAVTFVISRVVPIDPALAIVMGVVAVIMLATQFIPPIADLFGFARISAAEAGMVALLGIGQLVLLERLKTRTEVLAQSVGERIKTAVGTLQGIAESNAAMGMDVPTLYAHARRPPGATSLT